MTPEKWKWKVVVVDRVDFPPGGQPSELYKLLGATQKDGWEQVGYDPCEDVFIFRRLMNEEEKRNEEEKARAIGEYVRR